MNLYVIEDKKGESRGILYNPAKVRYWQATARRAPQIGEIVNVRYKRGAPKEYEVTARMTPLPTIPREWWCDCSPRILLKSRGDKKANKRQLEITFVEEIDGTENDPCNNNARRNE